MEDEDEVGGLVCRPSSGGVAGRKPGEREAPCLAACHPSSGGDRRFLPWQRLDFTDILGGDSGVAPQASACGRRPPPTATSSTASSPPLLPLPPDCCAVPDESGVGVLPCVRTQEKPSKLKRELWRPNCEREHSPNDDTNLLYM